MVAHEVVEILQTFVGEHTGLIRSRPVVLRPGRPPHLQSRTDRLVPFGREETEHLASRFGWQVGTLDEWKVCEDRPSPCRLRDDAILASISRPAIRGDRAVVAVSWYHNSSGLARYNARLLELTRDGSEWRLTAVLECVHTVGGGPCSMTGQP